MKTLSTFIVITAVFTSSVFAASEHQGSSKMQTNGMAMGMMSQEQMKEMHNHMQEMQKLMTSINQENDPEKREVLLQEHMKSMQRGMNMMMGDMKTQRPNMNMDERMSMMEQRMGMMQMMMGQMLESDGQQQKQRHGHK